MNSLDNLLIELKLHIFSCMNMTISEFYNLAILNKDYYIILHKYFKKLNFDQSYELSKLILYNNYPSKIIIRCHPFIINTKYTKHTESDETIRLEIIAYSAIFISKTKTESVSMSISRYNKTFSNGVIYLTKK